MTTSMVCLTRVSSSRSISRATVSDFHPYPSSDHNTYGIPGVDTETGPGVFETALAYTDALRMADNAILFKFLAKSMGMKHGVVPSFMAKPWGNVSASSIFTTTG